MLPISSYKRSVSRSIIHFPLISHIIRTMSNLDTSTEQPSFPTANKLKWWKPVVLILGVALILLMFIFSNELEFYWYHYRANRGDAEAQFNLALCYDEGKGVAIDQAEAVRWYRRAADQGDASAQHNLGVCYSQGTGVLRIMQRLSDGFVWLPIKEVL